MDRVDARAVGLVVTGLGGNRRREDDQIDYGVGLSPVAPIGAEVGPDRPLAIVHARGDASAEEAAAALLAAVRVSAEPPAERPRPAGARMTLPLAELHVHLEGTVPPALIQRLADRNGLKVPEGVFAAPDRFAWVDFLDFLRTYDLAASVIRTRRGLPRHHLRVPDGLRGARARSTSS